eukprot:jgi/Botrbrau1/8870/Bobra.50_2s0026.1
MASHIRHFPDLGVISDSNVAPSEDGADFDRGSVSTVATTASISSRIASLAVDFAEKFRPGIAGTAEFDSFEDQEEEVLELTEEEIMRELERQEPGLQVCSRLFFNSDSAPTSLKCLRLEDINTFRQQGFIVIDNFVSRELAAQLCSEALSLRPRFHEAASLSRSSSGDDHYTDHSARGDHVLWLHPGRGPATLPAVASIMANLQDLQEDLRQVMKLNQQSCEYQLAYYPPNGSQYVRHRDAFPDDGSEEHQRRVTAIVYANPGWVPGDGGKLRIWIPRTASYQDSLAAASGLAITSPTGSHSDVGARGDSLLHRHLGSQSHAQASLLSPGNYAALPHFESLAAVDELGPLNQLGDSPPPSERPNAHPDLQPASFAAANGHLEPLGAANGHLNGHLEGLAAPHLHLNGHGAAVGRRLSSEEALTCDQSDTASHRSDPALGPAYGGGSITSSVFVEATEASAAGSSHDASSVDEGFPQPSRHTRVEQGRQGVERLEVGTEAVVDVAPLPGRLVLMLAGAVEHAVLPNFAERFAVTAWCQ